MTTLQLSSPQLMVSINRLLPYEITVEILSRVPAESLFQCKRVSKPWGNAIKHPSFSKKHLNNLIDDLNSGKLSFIFSEYDIEPYFYTEYVESLNRFIETRINLDPPISRCRILGSCNGLILFMKWRGPHYRYAYICNPITRECIMLEEAGAIQWLAGFGYVPSTNEYKIVKIYNNRTHRSDGRFSFGAVEIYTLGSGIGWRTVDKIKMEYDFEVGREHGVFANGAIHWVNREGTIVAFDLAEEEIRVIPSPPCLPPAGKPELQVLGEFLCANYKYKDGLDIWVLKKEKNYQDVIWSKEFSRINAKPITFTKSGGLICYDRRDSNVYRYTPEASSPRMLVGFGENCNFGAPHKNTLVSLKALGEKDVKVMDSGERKNLAVDREE